MKVPISQIRASSRASHAAQAEPVLGAGVGYERGLCTNPFCWWHYKDKRFIWKNKGPDYCFAQWILRPEVEKEGYRLKEDYFKKYGDYGPARDRPENAALLRNSKLW